MKIKTLFLLTVFIASLNVTAQKREIAKVANEIDYDYFFKRVEFFADDKLKGRDVGSEGYALAADYTAKEFEINKLLPFGENDTYFQAVPFIKAKMNEQSFNLKIKSKDKETFGVYGENVSVFLNTEKDSFSDSQDLVFVGYGNVIPEKNIDDYKGLDVKGKTVIVAFGGPKGLKHPSLENPLSKVKWAVKKGASGMIIFFPGKGLFQGMIFKKFHAYVGGPRMFIDDVELKKPLVDMDIVSFVKKDYLKNAFKTAGVRLNKELRSMKKGGFVSQLLNAQVECSYNMDFEPITCKNVAAVLPGTDPVLKNEYIVVGAHLDHLGVGRAIKKDSIYNGMWDNATGSAATITIAKTFTDAKIKPKRSIIFVNYTGEEKGLHGSNFFANSELLKGKNIVANVNIDMLGGLYETSDMMPIGYAHSNISEAVDFAAKKLGITITDATPYEKMFIERSDQYSFIKIGTPPINIGGGLIPVNPKIDVMKETMKWMEKMYHSPFDDLSQDYSNKAFHSALKANFLVTYYLANEMDKIEWNPDSWIFKELVNKE